MNAKYKISVIIPTYNKLELLKRAVLSAVDQAFDLYEIYITDDCSSDYSDTDVEKFLSNLEKKSNPVLHYHRNIKNLGTVRNMNNAINAVEGEIIVQLSGDDYFCDRFVLKRVYEYFTSNNKYNICIGRRIKIEDQEISPNDDEINLLTDPNRKKELLSQVLINNFISGSTLYYKKDFMIQQGLYDTRYRLIEDFPFVLKMINNNYQIGVINEPTIFYSAGGVSSRENKSMLQRLIGIFKRTSSSEFQNETHQIMKDISLPLAFQLKDSRTIKQIEEELKWYQFKTGNHKFTNFIKWLPYLKVHLNKEENIG